MNGMATVRAWISFHSGALIDALRIAVVERQRHARQHHLLRHLDALPELARAAHLLHQRRRNRHAGLVVRREGRQRLRIPDPLLEHLRGRFREVALHREAAQALPRLVAAGQPVDDVPELVEQRPHLVVRHQTRDRSADPRAGSLTARPPGSSDLRVLAEP